MCCEGLRVKDYCPDCYRAYYRAAQRKHTLTARCFCGRPREPRSAYCKGHTKLYVEGILEPIFAVADVDIDAVCAA